MRIRAVNRIKDKGVEGRAKYSRLVSLIIYLVYTVLM